MKIKRISKKQAQDMISRVRAEMKDGWFGSINAKQTMDKWKEAGFIEKSKLEDCIERLEYYLEHKREEMHQDEIVGFNDIIASLKNIEEK